MDRMEDVKWFRRGAENGDAEAQLDLALCYVNGDGVEKNDDEAKKWLLMALETAIKKHDRIIESWAQHFLRAKGWDAK